MSSKQPSDAPQPGGSSRSGGDGRESLRITLPCSDVVEVPAGRASGREPGQTTLSAIGDVGVATDDLARRLGRAPQSLRLGVVAGFFFLLYIFAVAMNLYVLKSPPWVLVFVPPLFTVLIAALAYANSHRWKARALHSGFELKIRKDALGSLGHQAANSVNAIRANLIAFREAHPEHAWSEHLAELEAAVQRIDEVVREVADPRA